MSSGASIPNSHDATSPFPFPLSPGVPLDAPECRAINGQVTLHRKFICDYSICERFRDRFVFGEDEKITKQHLFRMQATQQRPAVSGNWSACGRHSLECATAADPTPTDSGFDGGRAGVNDMRRKFALNCRMCISFLTLEMRRFGSRRRSNRWIAIRDRADLRLHANFKRTPPRVLKDGRMLSGKCVWLFHTSIAHLIVFFYHS